jgi:hypothetical protein
VTAPKAPQPTVRGLAIAAGALTLASLGLPWAAASGNRAGVPFFGATATVGAEHPMRVFALASVLLLVWSVRQERPRLARLGILVGALALPLGLDGGLTSGRAVYAVALLLAAMAVGVLPRVGRQGQRLRVDRPDQHL